MDINIFKLKQRVTQKRACEFISQWMEQNNVSCNDICFDCQLVSPKRDYFKFHIRAINTTAVKTYFFELLCRGSLLEITYLHDSDDPAHLLPGDANYQFSELFPLQRECAHA